MIEKKSKKSLIKYLNRPILGDGLQNVDALATALPMLRVKISTKTKRAMFIVPDLVVAEKLYDEVETLNLELGLKQHILLLPETQRGNIFVSGGESERARVLHELVVNPPDIVIASVHAITAKTPSPQHMEDCEIKLKVGMEISMSELLEKLVCLDYDDELEVTQSGEFSRRGGILDIYSPAQDYPCRIEFFGDEIDSIRQFSCDTQRSVGAVDSCTIIAPHPTVTANSLEYSDFDGFDYIDEARLIVLFPEVCRSKLEKFSGEKFTDRFDEVCKEFKAQSQLFTLQDVVGSVDCGDFEVVECYPPLAHLANALPSDVRYGAMELMREMLVTQLRQWIDSDYKITLSATTPSGEEHLQRWCKESKFALKSFEFIHSELTFGAILPAEHHIILTERELFTANVFNSNVTTSHRKNSFEIVSKNSELGENELLSNLEVGDYAVHLDHGICRFRGIVVSEHKGIVREIMKLEFRDEMLLNLPLNQAHLVSRYLGASSRVVLHKLGASKWNRDKATASRAVRSYALDMLRVQALRASAPGISFPPDNLDSKLFLGAFPYTDTPDQTRSTQEITLDMEQPRPMDRLLCGDVGYGKTEVAMRAAFKAVSAGYQVVVLAPTTVLVQQHFFSFKERFAEEPFNIDMISRFRTPAEQREIFEKLEGGGIDIIIGTHGLCGNSVKFANLGLVIIDEEQRFGVKHKESLRRMRTEVDVLTLSATPIPRTLYLAMVGARDLSTLQSAPRARLPVKTVVAPEDISTVKHAINEEVERGGQVYYLHNRVKSIEDCCYSLASELPHVRFAFAHGQMKESELEGVMNRFMNREIDCLVCSTIIESGLDIPNANTIIIERADRFGLSALYQLRGRVGRRNQQAFAYMLLPKEQMISSDAQKRMAAIRRCSELGAGFQLALRDLEIRGSGNILGEEQSGHLNLIGFDLYCRLLKDEVANLQGKKGDFLSTIEQSIDFMVFGHEAPKEVLAMGIPPDFIDGVRQRITAYRRISALASLESVDEFQKELIDRYGKLPKCVNNLLIYSKFRVMATLAGYSSLVVADGRVMLKRSGNCGIYRERGRVPYIDSRNPLALRLALLRDILRRALKENNGQ